MAIKYGATGIGLCRTVRTLVLVWWWRWGIDCVNRQHTPNHPRIPPRRHKQPPQEHMFFSPERIDHMREMILSETAEEREKALGILFEFQKARCVYTLFCFLNVHVTTLSFRLLTPQLSFTNKRTNERQEDMRAMFEVMSGKHVTIRLLDPPLHEFLPSVSSV